MRGDAVHRQLELAAALARGLQRAARQRRLEHEHGAPTAAPRPRSSSRDVPLPISSSVVHSIVTGGCGVPVARSAAHRRRSRCAMPAFMSNVPGTVQPVAVPAERHPLERADRPDGVEVAEQQHRRVPSPANARAKVVAALGAGDSVSTSRAGLRDSIAASSRAAAIDGAPCRCWATRAATRRSTIATMSSRCWRAWSSRGCMANRMNRPTAPAAMRGGMERSAAGRPPGVFVLECGQSTVNARTTLVHDRRRSGERLLSVAVATRRYQRGSERRPPRPPPPPAPA